MAAVGRGGEAVLNPAATPIGQARPEASFDLERLPG
jgi:hypothetical protein